MSGTVKEVTQSVTNSTDSYESRREAAPNCGMLGTKNLEFGAVDTRVSDSGTAGTKGPVLIIGAGLIGGSLGLSLTRLGLSVYLRDASPTAVSLGASLGAGTPWNPGLPEPGLVVVATPPDVTAGVVCEALVEFPTAIVLDVSSVKTPIVAAVLAAKPDAASRYCSVHPMAGKEVNGIGAASGDLFTGRPWVVVAHPDTASTAVLAARTLGIDVGTFLVSLGATEHDRAVALVSHVPQLVSSLMAGLLIDAPATSLELAGGGLRDVTRVAASDPRLWNAILAGNSQAVREVLLQMQQNLAALIAGLASHEMAPHESETNPTPAPEVSDTESALDGTPRNETWTKGAVGAVNTVMTRGNEGVGRIPGKHGDAASNYGQVAVLVPDKPGFLGKLFQEIGAAGINIEDFRIEHSLGQSRGLAYIYVIPASVEPLSGHLQETGWKVARL